MVRRGSSSWASAFAPPGSAGGGGPRYGGQVSEPSPAPAVSRSRWRRIAGSAWFQLALAVVLTSLVLTFVAKPYWVPSGSMEQTLMPGDRVLVNRLAYVGSAPTTGDIVVFDADQSWGLGAREEDGFRSFVRWVGEVTGFGPSGEHTLIKRVIGGPEQTVSCCSESGAVLVDGEALDEPYVWNDFPFEEGTLDCTTTPRSTRCFDELTVPSDGFLVMGDNRAGSSDSVINCRAPGASADCARWARDQTVVGKAVVILWPISRWSGL